MNKAFNNATLHDAVLERLEVNWQDRTCEAQVGLVGVDHATISCVGVHDVSLPHASPWGESASINKVRVRADGISEIEMQSGDTIRIKAATPTIK